MVNTRAKGNKNELKAKALLVKAGWLVERTRPDRYGTKDFFNSWDLIAVKAGRIRWVQVKTNRMPPPAERKRLFSFPGPGSKEIWIFYDRKTKPRILKSHG